MPTSSLRIDILGTSFSISADEEPGYLENLLTRYYVCVENTRKITGLSDPLKLAIMTGFLLCEDIQKRMSNADLQEQHTAESQEVERIFLDINTRIDEILDTRELNSPSG
ncbi:MAG: cell division protein ZapA [Treponema sp.]|jgi:cell division protein ZapA (FtsZ GTPase activity inhibitor)|nr:cell division protein ZapA [Treponema sp.]